jgi:murein DD-endopeptidase MepM/ murein hydrolase activator NlpD
MASDVGRHKQSKYLTIMLIPSSSAKVRKIRIPNWAMGVLGIPLLCILFIVVLYQSRVLGIENLLLSSSERLNITIDENAKLKEALYSKQNITLENIYDRQKISEMFAKIEEIDGVEQEIINVFKEQAALNSQFLFDENSLSRSTIDAQGGEYPDALKDKFTDPSSLDAFLSEKISNLHTLKNVAYNLGSYYRARPTGWPVRIYKISSGFGYRRNPFTSIGMEMHFGLDINVPIKTNVYATADGVVSFAGWNEGGLGYCVTIDHDFGYSTRYAHNSSILVEVGEEVKRGRVIALSGSSGRSTGAHCHYEVKIDGVPQNPQDYLN